MKTNDNLQQSMMCRSIRFEIAAGVRRGSSEQSLRLDTIGKKGQKSSLLCVIQNLLKRRTPLDLLHRRSAVISNRTAALLTVHAENFKNLAISWILARTVLPGKGSESAVRRKNAEES